MKKGMIDSGWMNQGSSHGEDTWAKTERWTGMYQTEEGGRKEKKQNVQIPWDGKQDGTYQGQNKVLEQEMLERVQRVKGVQIQIMFGLG